MKIKSMMMVLAQFRQKYPQGSLVSELIYIDRGTYLVKASAIVDKHILATGFAGGDRIEIAEDKARERAIEALCLDKIASHSVPLTASHPDKLSTKDFAIATPPKASNVPDSSPTTPQIAIAERQSQDYVKNHQEVSAESTPVAVEPEPVLSIAEPMFAQPIEPTPESGAEPVTENLFAGTYNTATVSQPLAPETASTTAVANSPTALTSTSEDLDNNQFNEIKHKTDLEIKRLGWTKEDGMDFLKKHYGKRSRLHLTNEQLFEFLQYLESQPTPN